MCWRTAASTTDGRRTRLDIGRLDRFDSAGAELIEEMSREGVEVFCSLPEPKRRVPLDWLRAAARLSVLAVLLAFPPAF
jgi:hypothetical protein